MKKRRIRRFVVKRSIAAIATLAMIFSFMGNMSIVARADGDDEGLTVKNAAFEDDIWGEARGWSVTPDSWEGTTVKSCVYADEESLEAPDDGSTGGVNYYMANGGTITFSQNVSMPAGNYTFIVSNMGDGASYSVSIGDTGSDGKTLSGWNQWDEFSFKYTAQEDEEVAITITVDCNAGGWGYLNSLTWTWEELEDEAEEGNDSFIVNPLFEDDIWGNNAGWSVTAADWGESNTTLVETFTYAEDSWMNGPSDGSTSGVHFWSQAANTFTFSQEVTIPAGGYLFKVSNMGENASFALKIGDVSSDTVSLTGYNNWTEATLDYTAEEDETVTISIICTCSDDGWGYLNSISWTKKGALETTRTFTFDTTPVSGEPVESDLYAQKVMMMNDFITGADVSSYDSIIQSGATFKDASGNVLDQAGFFSLLKSSGVNYVRIRVWVDPANAEGQTYGGGACDLENAKRIGDAATNAGLKVLIDFHYSDFWTDPGKQSAPKAWTALSLDEKAQALQNWTEDSLNALLAAGVDVGMVQVGNETTTGFCGETSMQNMCTLFSAGSQGVRNVEESTDHPMMIVIHLTNPDKQDFSNYAKQLENNGVVYDVFATSYYPYWHGTLDNLYTKLAAVADTYGKYVMVAETSYVRTLEDGDGHGNTEDQSDYDGGYDSFPYEVSEQGQVNHIRALIEKIASIPDNKGIGVFWWEPAWIPVQHYDATADNAAQVLAQNKVLWEQYGSGWATSAAAAYDKDVSTWYGGSAVDNESWFDFDGKALSSIEVYNLVRFGSTAADGISSVNDASLTVTEGTVITLPQTVEAVYVSGDTTDASVVWNEEELAAAISAGAGTYDISGVATYEEETYDVLCHLTIEPANYLVNPGFEDGETNWVIDRTNAGDKVSTDDPHEGSKSFHFWSSSAQTLCVSQNVVLEPGIYSFEGYFQGESGVSGSIFAEVSGDTQSYSSSFELGGWNTWQNPQIASIEVAETTTVTVGFTISYEDNMWGTCDDFRLTKVAGPYSYSILDNGDNQTYTKGSGSGLTVHIDADYLKVDHVEVDNVTLASDQYTIESGSTIVTLIPSVLESLGKGTHTMKIYYTNGKVVNTGFNVSENTPSNNTSENSSSESSSSESSSAEPASQSTAATPAPTSPTATVTDTPDDLAGNYLTDVPSDLASAQSSPKTGESANAVLPVMTGIFAATAAVLWVGNKKKEEA